MLKNLLHYGAVYLVTASIYFALFLYIPYIAGGIPWIVGVHVGLMFMGWFYWGFRRLLIGSIEKE